MKTLTVGSKAYFDSFSGLVPCVVTDIRADRDYSHSYRIFVRFTAKRGPYRKGEIYESSHLHIVPREAVHVRSGQYRIGAYSVQPREDTI